MNDISLKIHPYLKVIQLPLILRIIKTVNGVTTYYNTRNGVILSQSDGTNTMYFQYDTNGAPLGFIWNGTQYLYMTNQMGDVISITNAQGNELVQYEYDEWGALGSVTTINDTDEEKAIANVNPLRYRGYYYDNETGYYYLQSRYYDASICRLINADDSQIAKDSKEVLLSSNLFAYCCNDPINNIDFDGCKYLPSQSYMYKGTTPPKDFGKQKLSESGITMLKACESFHSKAYKALSSEKYYTIGYGHYGSDVKKNQTITKSNADKLLRSDIKIYEKNLNNFLIDCRIYLNQKQFDACIIDSYQRGQNMWKNGIWVKYDLPCFLNRYRIFNDNKHHRSFNEINSAFQGTVSSAAGLKKRRLSEARLFSGGFYCTTTKQVYG